MFFMPKLPPSFHIDADPHTGKHKVFRHGCAIAAIAPSAEFDTDAEARAWIATEAKRKITYFDGDGREVKR